MISNSICTILEPNIYYLNTIKKKMRIIRNTKMIFISLIILEYLTIKFILYSQYDTQTLQFMPYRIGQRGVLIYCMELQVE